MAELVELLNSACGAGIEREKDADNADEFDSENVGESGDSWTPVVASAHVSGLLIAERSFRRPHENLFATVKGLKKNLHLTPIAQT